MNRPAQSNRRPRLLHTLLVFAGTALLVGCRRGTPESPATAAPLESIITSSGIEMLLVPAGEFLMGDASGAVNERPMRRVAVSAFYMDRYEMTQAAYQRLMGKNPAKSPGENKPVERVSWVSAAQFCNMRSLREGLEPCYDPQTLQCNFNANGYRLPTEAEWEYACRAGTQTRFSFGDDPRRLQGYAWYESNSNETTHPVGGKAPNPWGFYDMYGNVWEWCNDFYEDRYAAAERITNPRGPESGEDVVIRGGGWRSTEDECRSSARHHEPPALADVCFGYDTYGFRCVRAAQTSAEE